MSWDNTHFRQFANSLEATIASYGEATEDHYNRQKRQVETLYRLETEFRDTLIQSMMGVWVYSRFIEYVRDERKNILSARPFFRERQDTFKNEIGPALRDRNLVALQRFNINYFFISFVLKLTSGFDTTEASQLRDIADKVKAARAELIELNIPLAISRARVFARHCQRHLDYMDLIQIATEGLIAAIDKFVLPYGKNYGAVMYGRITGDLTEGNSETLIHFYPTDKRRIYTANKLVKEGKSFEEIAVTISTTEAVAKGLAVDMSGEGPRVSSNDLQLLHTAAVTVSGDSPGASEGEGGFEEEPMSRFEAAESSRPDVQFENAHTMAILSAEIGKLSVFEKKLLALKGINL